MADHSTRTSVREYPVPVPAAPVSDDLWTALYRGRRTACREHTAWVEHCAHLHQLADGELAVAS